MFLSLSEDFRNDYAYISIMLQKMHIVSLFAHLWNHLMDLD